VDDEPVVADIADNLTHTIFSLSISQFNSTHTTKTVRIIGTDPIDRIPPIARPGSNVSVYAGTVLTLDGLASTDNIGIKNYEWTFVDREPQRILGAHRDYTFTLPGIYTVMLNVTDLRGNWNASTITVSVLGPHAVTENNLTVQTGIPLVFNGSKSVGKGLSYIWTFVDGTFKSLSGPTPSTVFSTPGNYAINLTVTDAEGNQNTALMTVAVLAPPIWAQSWFWWMIVSSIALVSILFGFNYYHNFAKQKMVVLGYESELETLPISHPDRARARYIKDEIERRDKLTEFHRRYGIRIRPAGSFEDAMSRLGISGHTKKRR
jgi:hypothetical protein